MDLQWYYRLDLLLLSFIGLFLLFSWLYLRRHIHLARAFQNRKRWIFIKYPLRFLYFTALIIAALGPSFGFGKKYIEATGKDIFIAIDLSKSMDAQDISPSRLQRLQYELQNFLDATIGDRVGLIIFGTDAYLHCPLTYDRSALELFLQSIHTHLLPQGGTDFSQALMLAEERFSRLKSNRRELKNKVLVLASDGEDFGPLPLSVIQKYNDQGIQIFAIGIGSTQGSRIPENNGFVKTENGNIAQSRRQLEPMHYLAKQTGGAYYEVSKGKNEMPQFIKAIQELKGKKLDLKSIDVSHNKYTYFLWLALALILLDFIFIVKIIRF